MPPARTTSRRGPLLLAGLAILGGLLFWLTRDEPASAPPDDPAEAAIHAPRALPPAARPELALDLRLRGRAAISGAVKDPDGRPVPAAHVCAFAESTRLPRSDTRRAHCSLTASDGRYRIDGLFGVRHRASASAPTFIPAAHVRGEGLARRTWIELRPGLEVRDVDITLERGGVEVRGVVKDLSGGPVEGAQVEAEHALATSAVDGTFALWVRPGRLALGASAEGYAHGSDSGAAPGHAFEIFLTPEAVLIGQVVRASDGAPIEGARVTPVSGGFGWSDAAAFSDAQGNFRLDGLQPGVYKPRAESDDALGSAAEQVVLGLGETSDPLVIHAHPAALVEGRIVGDDGSSCDNGRVGLLDANNTRNNSGSSDADGLVQIRGVLPGEYKVSVSCPGHVSAERYDRVVVEGRGISGLKWQVARGQAIRGLVVDAAGAPIPEIRIFADPKPDPGRPRERQTGAGSPPTDPSGRFELHGLLPGSYLLRAHAAAEPRSTPPKPLELVLPAGEDLNDVRFELPATGEVRGSVRDAQGRPVPKVSISLSGVAWLDTPADDAGDFRFAAVAPGEYRLSASRGWLDKMRAPGTGDDDVQGEKVTVRVGRVETVKLVVEATTGTIRGAVLDEGGGPLADAFVEATRESDSAAAASGGALRSGRWGSFFQTPHLTELDGRFALTDLAPGKYTLRAHRKGGGEGFLEHVELGGDVTITMSSTGRMSGTLRLRGGDAPEDFRISVEDERSGFRRNDSFFRTGGVWSLPELPAGTYKVRASASAGSAELAVSMSAGKDTADVQIELAPRIRVRGVVVDLDGEPVAGLTVSVSGAGASGGGDEQKLNISDAQGRFEIANAPTGLVDITVRPNNWMGTDYDWVRVPTRLDPSGDAVELPPIRVSKRRIKEGDAMGDLGYVLKPNEPGADPLTRRLVVALVRPGSPAAAAGLQAGDEIVRVDGVDVTGPNAYLFTTLTRVTPGAKVRYSLARGLDLELAAGAPL